MTPPARRAVTPVKLALVIGLALVALVGLRATVLAPEQSARREGPAIDRESCPAEGRIGSSAHGKRAQRPASGYTFLFATGTDGCFPARFNPCEPVPFVLNDTLAPPGGVDDLRTAFDELASATGITFVEEGTTDEPLGIQREPYQPERYGRRWAPILVGWSALGIPQRPDGSGDDIIVVGRGRPLRVGDVLVSGVLELNADAVIDRSTGAPLPGGFGAGVTRGRVMLHELGHVVGLGHAGSPAQLMYPELAEHTAPTAAFGVGDLAGLRLLGAEAGCVEVPPLPGS